mmetsp:Transcript_35546/g.72706  ORF Transcript_35546/g.72706 Transcript_35546/m.72706 type:complete len:512 (+) Transcript_35546:160-1695(+)
MSSATKKPSLYARKLIDKLRTLNSNASLESRQTLANWMVFNRKKAEGMSEGMLLAICTTTTAGDEDPSSARLMLLLRVLHQVFIEGKDDSEAFEKAAQLRSILADVALIPLFQALATSCCSNNTSSNEQQREKYTTEVKEMIESWKEYSVFDGPTVWEGYKKAWGRAVTDTAASKEVVVGGSESDSKAATTPPVVETTSLNDADAVMDVVMGGQSSTEEAAASSTTEIKTNKEEDTTMKEATSIAEPQILPPSSSTTTTTKAASDNNTKGPTEHHPPARLSKRDSMTSVASIDIDFDAEGVEEAEVEPAKFLEASKVIASLQIARDLGSDAAMNLSSALGSVPAEVEQACSTIHTQQQEGGDKGTSSSIEELLSTEQLSNLPDEILDIDLDYARKSLQTYREAILQQRKARLQCLQLLLQSRCSFGSLDAARAFGCDDGSDEGMNIILEQLKKVKEKLIDAMALEGLDVEEDDADEKKMKEEEEQLKPLSWFPGQMKESEDEPEPKKQKVA